MKKHVLSLMMVLALMVMAGTSAMAQTVIGDITAAVGTATNPKVYLAGSTGSLSVTEVAGHTYTWNFYTGSAAGTAVTEVNVGTDAMASGFDVSATGTPTGTGTQTGFSAGFTWTESASGAFYATVTDEDANGCITIRGYHMLLIGFDIVVYASEDDGDFLDGAGLLECGDGDSYPAFMNNVSLNVAEDGIRGDIYNSTTTPALEAPTDGDLTGVHGINPRTTRSFTAALTFDAPATGSFTNPTVGSARLDISIGGTNMPAVDVYQINGSGDLGETVANVSQTLLTPLAVAPTTLPAGVNADYYFKFDVEFYERWGTANNLTPQALVNNFRVYTANDGTGTTLGQEPSADQSDGTNLSAEFTIYAKPATSIITGN